MAKYAKPFVIIRRKDSNTFRFSLISTCRLSERICKDWKRKSFYNLPEELFNYRNPKKKAAAQAGAFALIEYLKQKQAEGCARKVYIDDITVGNWLEKFTRIETSQRTGINASKNLPYSPDTHNGTSSLLCHVSFWSSSFRSICP